MIRLCRYSVWLRHAKGNATSQNCCSSWEISSSHSKCGRRSWVNWSPTPNGMCWADSPASTWIATWMNCRSWSTKISRKRRSWCCSTAIRSTRTGWSSRQSARSVLQPTKRTSSGTNSWSWPNSQPSCPPSSDPIVCSDKILEISSTSTHHGGYDSSSRLFSYPEHLLSRSSACSNGPAGLLSKRARDSDSKILCFMQKMLVRHFLLYPLWSKPSLSCFFILICNDLR